MSQPPAIPTPHPIPLPESAPNWDAIREILHEISALLDEGEISPKSREATLDRRAQQFATPPIDSASTDHQLHSYLTFQFGSEQYALSVGSVRTIAHLRRLTPVPCVPAYYRGVTNLNGKIVSVLDLRHFFGLEVLTDADDLTSAMVIVVEGAGLEMGLLVEGVQAVQEIAPSAFSSHVGQEMAVGIAGVHVDGLVLLDIEQLFRDPRLRIFEEPA